MEFMIIANEVVVKNGEGIEEDLLKVIVCKYCILNE